MNILVTGAAGFIGAALCRRLLARGDAVVGVDNLSDYYDVELKRARLARLAGDGFTFVQCDVADRDGIGAVFAAAAFDAVIHLAAQAGVRYSLHNPHAYIDANLVGFGCILEHCRRARVPHLLYASSSSVYGASDALPFGEDDRADRPLSLYAASKRANELMAYSYAHLYRLRCTGMRFFTVYGPWGRPDMAFFKFAQLMLAGEPIPVYNRGEMSRDFTYIDDAVAAVEAMLDAPPRDADDAPHAVYNIGNGRQVALMDYIHALERALGVAAQYRMMDMQDGDVAATCADTRALADAFGVRAETSIERGLAAFAQWHREYYGHDEPQP